MNANGFDHSLAVKQINVETIKNIETNTTDNLKHILEGSVYEKNSVFRFLPGHRASLLVLPELVENYEKTKSVTKKSVPKVYSAASSENSSECEGKEQLKTILIQKLTKYCTKINLGVSDLSEENIGCIEIAANRAGVTTYKCSVKCHICDLKIPCIFNKVWQKSNLEKHLKNFHVTEKSASTNVINSASEIRNELSNLSITEKDQNKSKTELHLPKTSNREELNHLLDISSANSNENSRNENVLYIPLNDSLSKLLPNLLQQSKQKTSSVDEQQSDSFRHNTTS